MFNMSNSGQIQITDTFVPANIVLNSCKLLIFCEFYLVLLKY